MDTDETLRLIQECREKDIRINIRYANLEGANLGYASLLNANLKFANLKYANLIGASLRHTNLEGANLWNMKIESSQSDDIILALGILMKDRERRSKRPE